MDAKDVEKLPLFAGLSKRQRKRLAPLIDEIDVPQGRELARQGDLAYEMFIIEDGAATVSKDGDELATLGAGDFFGEIALLHEDRRRTSTVTATTPMRVAVLHGHDVRALDRELPGFSSQLHDAVARRLGSDEQR